MSTNRLFLVCGFPGVGKTTLAHALAQRIGGVVVTSEKVIAELFKDTVNTGTDKDYSAQELQQGYDVVFKEVKVALAKGKTVIAEGSFRFDDQRKKVLEIARQLRVHSFVILVTCPDDILKQRINKRFRTGKHQFGYQAHIAVKNVFEPLQACDFVVDTARPIDQQLDDLLSRY